MITIPFTIPGERVRVSVRRVGDGGFVGAVTELLQRSPHRVDPRCPHFGLRQGPATAGCGGCTWQHIAYPEQLRLKSALVTRLIGEAVRGSPPAHAAIPGTPLDAPWGYRQKAHFVFAATSQRTQANRSRPALAMGHYVRGTRRIIPVVTCPVHDERGNALAFRLRDAVKESGITAADVPTVKGFAVRVAAGTDEMMATFVLTANADRRLRAVSRRIIEAPGGPSSFHVNIHPRGDAYIFGRQTRRITGTERMREQVGDTAFLVSPTAFFQTNVRAAEVLGRLVIDAVPHPSRVLDLYAGSGLFAIPLARAGNRVVAVENNDVAVADGEASRRLNDVAEEQCRFIRRRVEEALPGLRQRFDVVVLDPPRAGCPAAVIDGVFRRLAPPLAVYISCNPEALARDLRPIVGHGYEIASLQPVDMFPHTAHVETVAILRRRTRTQE